MATLDAQTLVATLVLQADAARPVGMGFDAFIWFDRGFSDTSIITSGTNYSNAVIVPEPSTAPLVGLVAMAVRRDLRGRRAPRDSSRPPR